MAGGRGKHSGSGTRNDIAGQRAVADQFFNQTLGRGTTDAEWNWLVSKIDDNNSAADVARIMMEQAGQDIAQVRNAATSYGFDLTPDQARAIYEKSVGGITTDIRSNTSGYEAAINSLGIAYANKQKDPTRDPFTGAKVGTSQYDQDVTEIFRSTLGRDPTRYELEHFGSQMLSGQDLYDLQTLMTTSPEYMEKKAAAEQAKYMQEAAAAREQLNSELMRQQDESFQRAMPQILSGYMKAGRLNSSSVDAAIANAKQELESQRQGYIGNIAYQDAVRGAGYNRENFVNNNANAFARYQEAYQPYAANQMSAWQTAQQLPLQFAQEQKQRQWDMQDYNRQQSDYERYYNQMNRGQEQAGMWGLGGQLGSGALVGLGSYFGGK